MKTNPKYQQKSPAVIPERETENIFVDWLTIRAKNFQRWPELNSGMVVRFDQDGEIEYQVATHIKAEGSHNSSAQLRVTHEYLELSFNPSRFNRSNNLFGCTYEESIQVADRILDKFNLKPVRKFDITRIDITQNRSTGGKGQLDAYIRHLKKRKLARKRTYTKYDSAIYQNTQLKITVYKKADEILAHNDKITDPETIRQREEIAEYCQKEGVARIEVRLNRQALIKRGLRHGRTMNHSKIVETFMKETQEIPRDMKDDNMEKLTDGELGSLTAWKLGFDPRERISKNTFYARRRAILQKTGYDIGAESPEQMTRKREIVNTWTTQIPGWYQMPFEEEKKKQKLELVEE